MNLFNVHLYDQHDRFLRVFVAADTNLADEIIQQYRKPGYSSYKVAMNSASKVKSDPSGNLIFPKYRTSKHNMQSKLKSKAWIKRECPHAKHAKLINTHYCTMLDADQDLVITIHTYPHQIRDKGYLADVLSCLKARYQDRVNLVQLDAEGFIIPAKVSKLEQLINDLVPDLVPMVEIIESDRLFTTKDHYGDYLNLLIKLCSGPQDPMLQVVAGALLQAGANADGMASAYRIYKA